MRAGMSGFLAGVIIALMAVLAGVYTVIYFSWFPPTGI
jgi:hypothetical protein